LLFDGFFCCLFYFTKKQESSLIFMSPFILELVRLVYQIIYDMKVLPNLCYLTIILKYSNSDFWWFLMNTNLYIRNIRKINFIYMNFVLCLQLEMTLVGYDKSSKILVDCVQNVGDKDAIKNQGIRKIMLIKNRLLTFFNQN
jgi:hypothetical protein